MCEYDLATVCKWIGNSPAVAAKHYATSVDLDADFRRAAGLEKDAAKAQQNAQQPAADEACQPMTVKKPSNKKAPENRGKVNPVQASASADAPGGWAIQDSKESQISIANAGVSPQPDANSDALQAVIDAWPSLPSQVRAEIVRLVQSTSADRSKPL